MQKIHNNVCGYFRQSIVFPSFLCYTVNATQFNLSLVRYDKAFRISFSLRVEIVSQQSEIQCRARLRSETRFFYYQVLQCFTGGKMYEAKTLSHSARACGVRLPRTWSCCLHKLRRNAHPYVDGLDCNPSPHLHPSRRAGAALYGMFRNGDAADPCRGA